jgi:hypothetical protein
MIGCLIRDAMSNAVQFTAIPGWGGVVMGVSAIVTALPVPLKYWRTSTRA